MSNGGQVAFTTLIPTAQRDGVDLRTSHRMQRLVTHGGRVVGVEATTPDGTTHRITGRKAVIFATGGFTHDADLRENFLAFPVLGGCAVLTNEGDFVAISSAIGAQLCNMNYPWMGRCRSSRPSRAGPTCSGCSRCPATP